MQSTSLLSRFSQSFEFPSLSAGGGGLNAIDNFGKMRADFEQLSKLQVPYLPSIMQHHTQMPLSLPQSCSKPVYANHLSSAQQVLQLNSFFFLPQY